MKVEAQLKDVETPHADSLRKLGKAMQDSIKNIRDYSLGKKQGKQGYGTPYQLTAASRLGDARLLILGKTAIPATQEETAVKIAEDLVQKCIDKINAFNNGAWMQYRKQVEAEPIQLFKNMNRL